MGFQILKSFLSKRKFHLINFEMPNLKYHNHNHISKIRNSAIYKSRSYQIMTEEGKKIQIFCQYFRKVHRYWIELLLPNIPPLL